MIRALQLGNKNFSTNIIQGPLAGISCGPFRKLIWQYSDPAFCCTEMISCKTLLHQSEYSARRFIKKDAQEGPVCFQLSSNNPMELGEAVKCVTDYGADLIDLNCGCPVKKIRSRGAGSKLLQNLSLLEKLISAMRKNTSVPISIKIRVEGAGEDKFHQELIKVIADSGLDLLIVHGRHWTEHYETACRHDQIQYFVENIKIPVIGNGDIRCINSLRKMLDTGCAGVMIGRAGVGQPWLIRKLIAEYNGESFIEPSLSEISQMFFQHVSDLADLLGNEKFALIQARKFAKYYSEEFSQKINQVSNLDALRIIGL
ncbi:MAG: tRNA-dihydrouridine synthase family protein [Gammaproteobacteria bacterium]|nr:tRNA-dihydrouridine synthase family protein [Gammaproteobacteria bacterium]